MTWPTKGSVNAEEILGMSQEELKSKLEKSATKDDLEEAIKTHTAPFESSLDEIKQQLKAITSPEPKAEEPEPDPDLEALTNPQKFLNDRMAPLHNEALETRAQLNEMKARQNPRYGEVWRQFGDELSQSAKKNFSAQVRAGDTFWDFHIRNVCGDKLLSGAIKPAAMPSLLGSSTAGAGGDSAGESERDYSEVDPEVGEFLAGRGVTADRVRHIAGLMKTGKITATAEAKHA